MQPARKLDRPSMWENPAEGGPKPTVTESGTESQPLEIKIEKMIFYLTVALGLGVLFLV